jgi:flagellar hook-associated protein 3 FlgL
VAAANISYAKDQKTILDRYQVNIQRADQRLTIMDVMLKDATNIITRAHELTVQASNDTYNAADRKAIAAEINQLKEALLGVANSKDEGGNYLFSGYKVHQTPFIEGSDEKISYLGDRGVHALQVSESMKMNTGIDGAEVFLRAKADGQATSVFSVLETLEKRLTMDTINKSTVDVQFKNTGTAAEGGETIQIDLVSVLPGVENDLSFTTAALASGDKAEMITAIKTSFDNLADKKGYSATLDNGVISFSHDNGASFTFEATETGNVGSTTISLEASLDDAKMNDLISGVPTEPTNGSDVLAKLKDCLEHFSVQRTSVGAQINKGEVQARIIEKRLILMDERISGMEDADLSQLVTELQSQLVNRDAAQQAFIKIGQQTLFDYLR